MQFIFDYRWTILVFFWYADIADLIKILIYPYTHISCQKNKVQLKLAHLPYCDGLFVLETDMKPENVHSLMNDSVDF